MIKRRNKLTPREGGIFVDIYSYDVQRCIKKNEQLVIEVGEEKMIIPPERLKSYHKLTKEKFISKFGGKDYYLYSYRWKPTTPDDELKMLIL